MLNKLFALMICTLLFACGNGTEIDLGINGEARLDLQPSTDYVWSVRAVTDEGAGEWSTDMEFSIHPSTDQALADAIESDNTFDFNPGIYNDGQAVPTAVPVSPIGAIVSPDPVFTWEEVLEVKNYDVRIRTSETKDVVFTESFKPEDVCRSSECNLQSSNTNSAVANFPTVDNSIAGAPGGSPSGVPVVGAVSGSVDSTSTAEVTEIENLQASEGVLAFPGALGYGRFSKGGRNGRIVTVNTIENIVNPNDNLLSLREAITIESGPRTIVFSVGGVFDTGVEPLRLVGEDDSNLTVACQTAPSPGVVVKTFGFNIQNGAHDVIFRHCTVRGIDVGALASTASRGFTIRSGSRNVMLDHVSLSWATDEGLQAYISSSDSAGIDNFTLSNSIVAEGDADSSHPESAEHANWGYHSMGPSCNNNNATHRPTNCSIVNNFIAHNSSRNAMIWGGAGELSNNVIYNWYGVGLTVRPQSGSGVDAIVNNNLMKSGPSTVGATGNKDCGSEKYQCAMFLGVTSSDGVARYSVGNNYFIPRSKSIADAELIVNPNANTPAGKPSFQAATASPQSILNMAARGARFMDCVGASRPLRDSIDARVVEEFYRGAGAVGIGENVRAGGHNVTVQRDFRGYASSTSHPAGYDSDKDGMPDKWELIYGLNPQNPNDHNGDLDGDGYTNIEEYLAIAAYC